MTCTGWRNPIRYLKVQVICRNRATNCRALLQKMIYKDIRHPVIPWQYVLSDVSCVHEKKSTTEPKCIQKKKKTKTKRDLCILKQTHVRDLLTITSDACGKIPAKEPIYVQQK